LGIALAVALFIDAGVAKGVEAELKFIAVHDLSKPPLDRIIPVEG
jgi:hypothetical protein